MRLSVCCSATFFVTFWSMSMYDLAVPTTVYDKQIQQLTSQIATIEDNDDLVCVTSQTTSKFQVVRGIFYLIGIYCTAIKHDKTIIIEQLFNTHLLHTLYTFKSTCVPSNTGGLDIFSLRVRRRKRRRDAVVWSPNWRMRWRSRGTTAVVWWPGSRPRGTPGSSPVSKGWGSKGVDQQS